MKYAGMIFVVVSAASVGLQMSTYLRGRCRLIQQILTSLQILRNEISVCGTPLPQAFALIAVSANGAVERLCAYIAREMDKNRWMTPLNAMEQGFINDPAWKQEQRICDILCQCASGLGKYDRASQLQVIDQAVDALSTLLMQTEQEHNIRGKTYRILGICAGLSMVILLA